MKKLAGAFLGFLMLAVWLPKVANVADVDWLGRISGLGGAERESARSHAGALNGGAHALGTLQGMGVIPITPAFGLQLGGGVAGGNSFRLDFQGGPIFGWSTGKAGVFWGTQIRKFANGQTENDGAPVDRISWSNWIRPAVSFYFSGLNLDVWYSTPVGRPTHLCVNSGDVCEKRLIGLSEGRIAANWFPSFFMKDNLELTLGLQVTALSGPENNHQKATQMGVGPVFGAAMMPWQNLEFQVFKAQIDNRNRYRVTSGLQYYFNKGNATLLQLRRMYLEPTNLPGLVSTDYSF